MTRGPYYADDLGYVRKHPIEVKRDAGSSTFEIGFPVCRMTDIVGREAAATVAEIMNRGHLAVELVSALDEIFNYSGGAESALDDPYVMERAYAALAKGQADAEGEA